MTDLKWKIRAKEAAKSGNLLLNRSLAVRHSCEQKRNGMQRRSGVGKWSAASEVEWRNGVDGKFNKEIAHHEQTIPIKN